VAEIWQGLGKTNKQTNKNSFLGVGPCCGYDDGCVEL